MDFTTPGQKDLDSPCRELSNCGLGIFVALLVCQEINLPTNQKGYDTFETTVGKLSARRIRFFSGPFLFRHYFESYTE